MSRPLMLDASELAYLTGLGRDTTYQALEDGTLPGIRVGRTWRIPAHRLANDILGCTVDDILSALAERDNEMAGLRPERNSPEDQICPRCGAEIRKSCKDRQGRERRHHQARIRAAQPTTLTH